MSTNVRFLLALLGAAALAVLATPELASKLPPGLPQLLAAALAGALHKMNAEGPPAPPEAK